MSPLLHHLLFFRACQLVAGTGSTLGELKAKVASSAASATSTAAPPTWTPSAQGCRIKLSSVISRIDDSEILVAEEKEILKCYGRYERVFGTGEPTAEQLSGLMHLTSTGQPPYADFSVFGPFGHGMMTRIKLSGYDIERDGTLRTANCTDPAIWALGSRATMCCSRSWS